MPIVRYKHNPVTRQMEKVSENVRWASGWQEEDTPFKEKVLNGYRKQEERGKLRSSWKAETIKKIWS